MKKIIGSILILYVILGNTTFGSVMCQDLTQCNDNQHCVCGQNKKCNCINDTTTPTTETCTECTNNCANLLTSNDHKALQNCIDDCSTSCHTSTTTTTNQISCSDFYEGDIDQVNGTCQTGYEAIVDTTSEGQTINCCTPTDTTSSSTNKDSTSIMGISCSQTQLVNGQCKLNIYDTLGIRKSVRNTNDATSVGLFVQDIVLSATFFIGTLVTIALVVSGLMYIFAASSGKDPADAKKGIIGSLVGLLIVVSSYVIIRLVQYIAKGF